MTPNARGYVLASVAIGAFALVAYLSTARTKATTPALDARAPVHFNGKECDDIAARYELMLGNLRACTTDVECRVDDRTRFYATIDGCYRILGAERAELVEPRRAADALAEEWVAGGCVHSFPTCEKRPTATCRLGQCVERPPPPVPLDWHRERIQDLLTMFLPPDMHRAPDVQGDDSVGLGYQGSGRRISMEVGTYSSDPSPDAHFGSAPQDTVLPAEDLIVSGRKTRLQRYKENSNPRKPTWSAQARIPNVAAPGSWSAGPSSSDLFFALDCDTKAACEDATIILGSLEVLSESIAQ